MRRLLALAIALLMAAPAAPALAVSPPDRASIAWNTCLRDMPDFECGTLTVPVDWDDTANPDTAQIAFAMHRATGSRIGGLSFNPGGPGGSGMNSALSVFRSLPQEVRDRFDFVAWDPRGVGQSTPRLSGCARTPQPDPALFPATGRVDWAAIALDDSARSAPMLAECFAANPRLAPYLGTYYVIRDLDALRSALGYAQWNFWGMSYGTRIGYRYARQFPDRVRALILDGSVAPNETMIYRGAQGAYKYAQSAAAFGAGEGPEMAAKLRRITTALNHRTVVINGRERSRWDILGDIYTNISNQGAANYIARIIDRVYAQLFENATPLRWPRLSARSGDDTSQRYLIDMVNCADVRDRPTLDEIVAAMKASYETNSVVAATSTLGRGMQCEGLPENFAPTLPYLTKPLQLPTPPVVLQSYGDSRTAWTGGREMASAFAGAPLITYEGTQHVAYMRLQSPCINDAITNYLLTLEVPTSRTCPYAPVRS